jgi:polyisoprenyl-teichoic acid--peptidoglycan teichoic acid transferase
LNFEDYPRPSMWKRFLAGAALVVFAAASATAVAAFNEVDAIVEQFRKRPELKLGNNLARTDPGKPQTIMLIGSDKRNKTARDAGGGARSDTILLVRLDPSKRATAMMSLPRDLKVQIPGHGTDKINAAYELGGPKLTLQTVKLLTGLQVNHVINVDFRGFVEGIDAIGCVFLDIDRRYFNNDNSATSYAAIDVKPGYQRVCGRRALDYARFRHEDNDLVRSARQQNLLREAKQQVGVGQLIEDRRKLTRIFVGNTESDLRDTAEILRLLKLAVFSVDQPVREVHFEGQITSGDEQTNTPSYVVAGDATVKKLTAQFLGVEETPGPRGTLKPKGKKRKKKITGTGGLEKAPDAGKDQAVQAIQQGAGRHLPVYYPTVRTTGSLFAGPPRVYKIRTPQGKFHQSYRVVIKKGLVGEYYGVQGTTWKDPPILEDAHDERKIGRRTFELHYDGDRLRLVAWRTKRAVYWVSNTLLQTLSTGQMVAIAKSTRLP